MEMDEGEQLLAFLFTVLGGLWLAGYSLRVLCFTQLVRPPQTRIPLLVIQPACLAALWFFIATHAAGEVRETIGYQILFVAATAIAFYVATKGFSALGLDPVADGVERRNTAAQLAIAGLWIAVTVCSAGANLGEGDSIITTLAPLTFAVITLLALAAGLSAATHGFSAVAIEHDIAAGIRLAVFLIAASLPLARASSGDWVSLGATLGDLGKALVSLIALLAVAIGIERRAPRRVVVPVVLYLAIAWVATRL